MNNAVPWQTKLLYNYTFFIRVNPKGEFGHYIKYFNLYTQIQYSSLSNIRDRYYTTI